MKVDLIQDRIPEGRKLRPIYGGLPVSGAPVVITRQASQGVVNTLLLNQVNAANKSQLAALAKQGIPPTQPVAVSVTKVKANPGLTQPVTKNLL